MKTIKGIINGIDVQAIAELKPRTQAFVVQNNTQIDVQITTYDFGLQIALTIISMQNVEVIIEYDEESGNLISISGYDMNNLFDLAKKVAKRKGKNIEENKDEKNNTIRVRVLDRD